VLAIGTSTGGPNALSLLLRDLPGTLSVPIVIVQHMPPLFTKMLAERLTATTPVAVDEVTHGQVLVAGRAYLAPGDQHMVLVRVGAQVVAHLNKDPPEQSCRPSVDVLFRSVAALYGGRSLGVVLWESLAQRRLFTGRNDLELLLAVRKGDVPRLEALRPDVPRALVEAIHQALAPDPGTRFVDALAMAQGLAQGLRTAPAGSRAALGASVRAARVRLAAPTLDVKQGGAPARRDHERDARLREARRVAALQGQMPHDASDGLDAMAQRAPSGTGPAQAAPARAAGA
jgi:hypothetical protein